MLALEDVSKTYDGHVALHPTTLAPAPGRTTVLIGPSGCGKSTVLRLFVGLVRPDAGTVRFDGQPVAPENVLAIRQRIGYMIQEGGLFPHLTARQNVILMARHLGWDAVQIDRRVAELAALVGLPEERLARYPGQLSGGQRQRVGLMRALLLDPAVLLLDEPLGALDPMIRAGLQTDLRAIFRRLEKTVVLVTHDLAEAAYFGDEIVLLRAGHVVQRGALQQFFDAPAEPFVEAFVKAQRSHRLEND